jgi:ferrous iron transport protein B
MEQELGLSENELDIIGHITAEMESALGSDREAALADMRYRYIETLCDQTYKKAATPEQQRTVKIDALLTNKYLAIRSSSPSWALFLDHLRGHRILPQRAVHRGNRRADPSGGRRPDSPGGKRSGALLNHRRCVCRVGSVLSFLPTIVILFFFLSMLEDSGYMARVCVCNG